MDLKEIRSLVKISLWAALIAVGGWLHLNLFGVIPLSLQTFFLFLAAFKDGAKIATLSCYLYIMAGLIGLPVFASGFAGFSIFFSPTIGFLFSFPIATLIVGALKFKAEKSFFIGILAASFATIVMYCCGAVGLLLNLDISLEKAFYMVAFFIPGDIIKICVSAALALKKLPKLAYKNNIFCLW